MKTLGVVAGFGPYAANSFIRKLLVLTNAEKEWDQFPLIAYYNTQIPSRTRALLYGETSPAPLMIDTIHMLENNQVDVVVIPCNSAHGWYDEVTKNIKVHWLNIIKVTSEEVKKKGIRHPLVVSAYVPWKLRLYDQFLDDVIYLDEEDMDCFYEIIERLKKNHDKTMIKKEFYELIQRHKDDADGLIIACTEPSMLFGSDENMFCNLKLVDSALVYAQRCVSLCLEQKGDDDC